MAVEVTIVLRDESLSFGKGSDPADIWRATIERLLDDIAEDQHYGLAVPELVYIDVEDVG